MKPRRRDIRRRGRKLARRTFLLLALLVGLVVLAAGSANGQNSGANSALIQPDGKIVAAGWGEPGVFGLARYTPDGSLDPSFGSGGEVTTPPASWPGARGIALQPDGKIVAAGSGPRGFGLSRYNSDGSLDKSFGTGGKVTTAFGSLATQAYAVAIQADGKIVAAGPLWKGGAFSEQAGFALARYNADGSLDTSFGTGGRVTTKVGEGGAAFSLAIQADGKLVAAGSGSGGFGSLDAKGFALVRYNPDGSIDTSFGSDGIVISGFGWPAAANAVALQPDGKIVAAGSGQIMPRGYAPQFLLARYNPEGSLDASFGSDGVAEPSFGDPGPCDYCGAGVNALAIRGDGKIVAAGQTCMGQCGFALARYTSDGSLDPGFGSGGTVTTSFGFPEPVMGEVWGDYAEAVALQSDGKIVAAGYSNFGPHRERYMFALTRYNPDGSLDTRFGKAGKVNTSVAACVVPKVKGETLSWTKHAVKKANCTVGKIRTVSSRTVEKKRIVSQKPGLCMLELPGTKVNLVVSTGSRRPQLVGPGQGSFPGTIAYDSRNHLFCTGGSGRAHIFTVNPNGTGRRQLTLRRYATNPLWSPDGREIAFSAGGVRVMNADGTHVRLVAPSGGSPTFSPDGKRIAFGGPTIWSVRTSGKDKHRIARGWSPDWSPDGSKIAFERNPDLYTVSSKGGRPRALTHFAPGGGSASSPAWSPNGKMIAFIYWDGLRLNLAVVNSSSGAIHVVAPDAWGPKPAWSPDGRRIAYVREERRGETLVTAKADGSGFRMVTRQIGGSSGVSWRRR